MKQINKRKRKFNFHNGAYNYIQPSITKIHKQPLHHKQKQNEVDYKEDHWFY